MPCSHLVTTYIVDRKVIWLYRKNSSAELLGSKFSQNSKLVGAIVDGDVVVVQASFRERGPDWSLCLCRLHQTCYNICNTQSQKPNTVRDIAVQSSRPSNAYSYHTLHYNTSAKTGSDDVIIDGGRILHAVCGRIRSKRPPPPPFRCILRFPAHGRLIHTLRYMYVSRLGM